MWRLATSLAVLLAATGGPALAADWSDDWSSEPMRGTYSNEPANWTDLGDTDDSVSIETGLRYWYSWGAQNFELGGASFTESDNAHTLEGHIRIDDHLSRSYGKANVGFSAALKGSYDDPLSGGEVVDGGIAYAGADFGWYAVGDGKGSGLGGLIGYQYWNDSPRTARMNFTTAASAADVSYNPDTGVWSLPGDSVDNNFDLHMLRLGVTGKAEFGEFFDISAEVAAVPYASLSGVMGGVGGDDALGPYAGCDTLPPGGCSQLGFQASEVNVSGWGYGAMGELMAGFHPTENITFRLGGRAWYVNGTYDATYSRALVTAPQLQPEIDDPNSDDPLDTIPADPLYSAPLLDRYEVIHTENPFSLLRYGILAELTYRF